MRHFCGENERADETGKWPCRKMRRKRRRLLEKTAKLKGK